MAIMLQIKLIQVSSVSFQSFRCLRWFPVVVDLEFLEKKKCENFKVFKLNKILTRQKENENSSNEWHNSKDNWRNPMSCVR